MVQWDVKNEKVLAAQSEKLPYGHSVARPWPPYPMCPCTYVPVTDRLRRPVLRRISRRSGLTRCGSRRPRLACCTPAGAGSLACGY